MAARARMALAGLVLAGLLFAAPALAAGKHYQWHTMSLQQRITAQRTLIARDHKVIQAWVATRWHPTKDPHVSWADPAILATPAPPGVWWHERHLAWTTRELHESLKQLAARPQASTTGIPWAFWDCVATGQLYGRTVSVGEGGATSVDPTGTYYGRYQMDLTFQRSHGADMLAKYHGKPATSWSVLDQTIVAERGYQVQGPYAWPNTAPPCLSLR